LTAANLAGAHFTMLALDGIPYAQLSKVSAPSLINGALGSAVTPPPTETAAFPELKVYTEDMQAEAATGDHYAGPDYTANAAGVATWLSVQAFAKVAAGLKDVTPAAFLQAFKNTQNLDLWNLIPNWTPNANVSNGHGALGPYPRASSDPYVFFTIM